MADVRPIHLIKRVTRWASSDAGDAIQLETVVEDGSPVIIRSAYQDVPRLLQSIIQAASIAEQVQNRMPGQGIELVSPYIANEVHTGTSADGKLVALKFATTEGVPIEVAMPASLARETIERLSAELEVVETAPPQKLS
jgi:hypothetical protein